MTMNVDTPPIKEKHDMTAGILARAGQILFMLIFLGLILFLGSGHLNWTAAWVYLGISLLGILINATFLLRTKPEMVAERGKPKEMKGWDKLVSGMMALTQYLLLPMVAALDLRFGWTREFSRVWQGLGGLVYAGGLGLTSWAMIANAYFSTAVRIQSDRGQIVCSTGPYHYVRHPGYVGFISSALGMAILLGSLWALIPAALTCFLIMIRTSKEDRMLQEELPGYKEYTQAVKYRLLPGVW